MSEKNGAVVSQPSGDKKDVITRILKANPGKSPTQVLDLANKEGVDTTIAYVRLVRGSLTANGTLPKLRRGRPANGGETNGHETNGHATEPAVKPRRKHGQAIEMPPTSDVSGAELFAVKELSAKFGGLDQFEASLQRQLKVVAELRRLSA